MKKIIIAILFLVGFSQIKAQEFKLGFRLAPNLSFTNVSQEHGAYPGIKQKGVGVRMSLGPTFDYYLADNITFSSGLWYTVKAVNVDLGDLYNNEGNPYKKYSEQSRYNLQYLQIPITFKFYTDEITDDIKLYCQLGGTIDIKLAEKGRDTGLSYGSDNYFYNLTVPGNQFRNGNSAFKRTNFCLYLGVGAEKPIFKNNAAFVSLNYTYGLTRMLKHMNDTDPSGNLADFTPNLHLKTNQLSLEVGLKF